MNYLRSTVGRDPQVNNEQWGTYPCLGAPNREHAIHGRIPTLEDEHLLLYNQPSGLPQNRAQTIKHLRAVEVSPPGTDHAIYPTRPPVGFSAFLPLFLVESPVCASLCGRQRPTCGTCDACSLGGIVRLCKSMTKKSRHTFSFDILITLHQA